MHHTDHIFGELGDRFHSNIHVDTRNSLYLSFFLHDTVRYYNEKKKRMFEEIDGLGIPI